MKNTDLVIKFENFTITIPKEKENLPMARWLIASAKQAFK